MSGCRRQSRRAASPSSIQPQVVCDQMHDSRETGTPSSMPSGSRVRSCRTSSRVCADAAWSRRSPKGVTPGTASPTVTSLPPWMSCSRSSSMSNRAAAPARPVAAHEHVGRMRSVATVVDDRFLGGVHRRFALFLRLGAGGCGRVVGLLLVALVVSRVLSVAHHDLPRVRCPRVQDVTSPLLRIELRRGVAHSVLGAQLRQNPPTGAPGPDNDSDGGVVRSVSRPSATNHRTWARAMREEWITKR